MYEQIKKVLRTKQNIIIQRDDGWFIIISNIKDYSGDFRTSDWHKSSEEAKANISIRDGYSKSGIEKYSKKDNWQIVDAFDFEPNKFEVGQEVMVMERDGDKTKSRMDNNTYRISEVKKHFCVVEGVAIPNSNLCHPFKKPQSEVDKALKVLENNNVNFKVEDGKIIIK